MNKWQLTQYDNDMAEIKALADNYKLTFTEAAQLAQLHKLKDIKTALAMLMAEDESTDPAQEAGER